MPSVIIPTPVMSTFSQILSDTKGASYDSVLSLFSSSMNVSLPVQYIHGLNQMLKQTATDTSQVDDVYAVEIKASLDFLELLYFDLLFGDSIENVDYNTLIQRFGNIADQQLIQSESLKPLNLTTLTSSCKFPRQYIDEKAAFSHYISDDESRAT